MSYFVNFTPISNKLAYQLLEFVDRRNIDKSIVIDGKTYKLNHISVNSNQFWKSRGFSCYFRVDRSIVRISDHWASSVGNDKSRKLNCGQISGKRWNIGISDRLFFGKYAGKYSWVLLAGKATYLN